ncbi:MAG TPA: hypothetical protein PKG60_14350 [Spirochaetota bacterium]|nr:hypothetical protein [Spirochaetota bacterium]
MKNKNRMKKVLLILILSISICSALSGESEEVVFDAGFFKNFNARPMIQRDDFLDNLTNKIVIGRGIITGISVNERYKKQYRILIESSDSAAYNQKFIFFVFLENKDTIDLLSLNSKFEFKGQLMGYTPLGTKRNEYILDVILMDGSTVIE